MKQNSKTQKLQHISGFPCPHCGNLIPISMQQILQSYSLYCPVCGLHIETDKKRSDKAIEALKKVTEVQKEIEEKYINR